jgi:PAS domain S-box-containing protein
MYHMSIRIKALIIIGFTMVGTLCLLYYVANHILLSSFSDLENRDVQEDVRRASNAIATQLQTMEHTAKDWGYWDETYQFMQDGNDEYVSDNLTFETMANLDLDMMVFVDPTASIKYARVVDLESGNDAVFPETFRNYMTPQSPLLMTTDMEAITKGLVEVEPHRYMLIVSAQILTNDATGPSAGTLILGRYLNDARVRDLTTTTRLDFTLIPAQSSQGTQLHVETYSSPFELDTPDVFTLNNKENVGVVGLSDLNGEPALIIELHAERDIYGYGQETFRIMFGVLMIIELIAAAGMLFLLEKSVLARLSDLGESVSQISESDDVTISISGTDEIAKLGSVINTMLTTLRESKAKLNLANQTLELKVVERTQQLEQSYNHTEAILASSSDALVTTDENGVITQINPAFALLFGYEDNEAHSLHVRNVVTDESFDVLREQMDKMVLDRKSRRIDVTARCKDGTVFNAEVALSVLISDDNAVFGSVASIRDISQHKMIEDNLREALAKERELRDLKTRFISMASHEFRTPLAIIQASVELMHYYHEKLTDPQKADHFDKIVHQIKHMTDLLDQVLTMNRHDFGDLDYNPVPTDLDALCREIVDDFKLATNATHGQTYSISGQVSNVMVDPSLIRHALSNLLSNGIKYSPENSTIDMKVIFEEYRTVIKVSDQGIGIPLKDQKYLFQPFHRAQNVGTIPGTGLGLPITKQAVELHGGSITYESEEGIGTTFTIILPHVAIEEPVI